MFLAVFAIASCGGGGSSSAPPVGNAPPPNVFDRYSKSDPLIDNSGADDYKVLLMGNSHASGLTPVLDELLVLGQPGKTIEVRMASRGGFLDQVVGENEDDLEGEAWTHVILQGQRYSTTGVNTYPTNAAEYWVRGSKLQGATPVMFPEHPRSGNDWEGQTIWELHKDISVRENTCVAPVGLVWDEVIFRDPTLDLYLPDGNHASSTGLLLTALVFYPVITGQPVDSLPDLSSFGIDAAAEQIMKDSVSSLLFTHPSCEFDQ